MNKHFRDTGYYLKRAGQTAKRGVAEELAPVRERVESLVGEEEPDPTRIDAIREDLRDVQSRAEGEAKEAIAEARGKLEAVSERRAS